MQRGCGDKRLRTKFALAECAHNHAGDLAHAPPHKHQTDANGNCESKNFNHRSYGDLCRNCVNDALESSGSNSSRSRCQTFSFPLKLMDAGVGFGPTIPHDKSGVLTTTLSRNIPRKNPGRGPQPTTDTAVTLPNLL